MPKSWDKSFDASCHWEEVSDSGDITNTILFFKDGEFIEWSNNVLDSEEMIPKSVSLFGIKIGRVDDCLYRAEGTQRRLYLFIGKTVWAFNEKLHLLPFSKINRLNNWVPESWSEGIDAAFWSLNHRTSVLIKGKSYIEVDDDFNISEI